MKIDSKINTYRIIRSIIVLAFLASSYVSLLPTSYIDDVLVIFLGGIVFIKFTINQKKIHNFDVIALLLLFSQILYLIPSIVLPLERAEAFMSFFSYLKIIIIIFACFCTNNTKEEKEKIQKILFLCTIPNILRGINEYYIAYILKQYIESGKYELGVGFRLQGYTGHPIYFSLLLIMCILYLLYIEKGKIRYLIAIVCSYLCIYTWTSFSLVLMLGLWIGYIFKEIRVKKMLRKFIKPILVIAFLGAAFVLVWYSQKENYTIRAKAIMGTIRQLSWNNAFIGNGYGSFTKAGYSESYFFHLLYDNGILGIASLFYPIIFIIVNQIKSRNYMAVFFASVFAINTIINEGYLVPYILYFPIICNFTTKDYLTRKEGK